MRLGLNVGYWGLGGDSSQDLALVQEAERLGYSVVWVAEAYGSDAVTVLTWIAAQTSTIDVGSAILQIPARTPPMTAMTAATLDSLSGGRFRLGLGVSGPQVSEGWHGVRFAKPLARTREYVDVVRLAQALLGQNDGLDQLIVEGHLQVRKLGQQCRRKCELQPQARRLDQLVTPDTNTKTGLALRPPQPQDPTQSQVLQARRPLCNRQNRQGMDRLFNP